MRFIRRIYFRLAHCGFVPCNLGKISHINAVTAEILENELKTLSEAERSRIISGAIQDLSPQALRELERKLRRFAHPEVPEDVWTGFEEAEDGRGIEIRDEHFEQPPV